MEVATRQTTPQQKNLLGLLVYFAKKRCYGAVYTNYQLHRKFSQNMLAKIIEQGGAMVKPKRGPEVSL
jgi:hypothetical protein